MTQTPPLPSFPFHSSSSSPFFLPPLFPSPPLEVGPFKSSYGVWGSADSAEWGLGTEIEFGAFGLKIWNLVATILIIFLIINWPNLNFVPPLSSFGPQGFLWRISVGGSDFGHPCEISASILLPFSFVPSPLPPLPSFLSPSLSRLCPPVFSPSSFPCPCPRS